VAAFTNLSHDHLDFHGTMERYFAAKAMLFEPDRSAAGVITVDDPWGRRLADACRIPVTTVSAQGDRRADVVGTVSDVGPAGTRVTVSLRGRRLDLLLGLAGRFNVANALTVIAAADALGIDPGATVAALRRPRQVPGRMERVDAGQPFTVLVDYAHTPDSLQRVLAAARELSAGRVIAVVGCGGDRDRAKRPHMGATAVAGADHTVFTNDNPRGEDPLDILEEILQGARAADGGRWSVEPDRRAAIAAALSAAHSGDTVVVAGKGHETGQQLADRTIPFDDRQVVRELLQEVAS
jgi:UDP-N-acetylmuramoyl-L-alanyl-D-glutamate--2,6-diaminopimelate ligase